MENFNITCAIKNEKLDLNVRFKKSSITYFYIYKANTWIGTLQKHGEKKYRLLSYSSFHISLSDLNVIGEQISRHEKIHVIDSPMTKTLKAA